MKRYPINTAIRTMRRRIAKTTQRILSAIATRKPLYPQPTVMVSMQADAAIKKVKVNNRQSIILYAHLYKNLGEKSRRGPDCTLSPTLARRALYVQRKTRDEPMSSLCFFVWDIRASGWNIRVWDIRARENIWWANKRTHDKPTQFSPHEITYRNN